MHHQKLRAFFSVLFFYAYPFLVSAADTKCSSSDTTPLECLLQTDEHLASLKEKMDEVYNARLLSMEKNKAVQGAFKYEQVLWLKTLSIGCSIPRSAPLTDEQVATATSCLEDSYRLRTAELEQRCELGEATLKELNKTPDKLSPKIPAGLKLDDNPQAFMIRTPTSAFYLPSDDSKTLYGLRIPHTGRLPKWFALCRVQDPDGNWWFVTGVGGTDLTYVPEGPAEQADAYEAEAKKSRQEMAERRKHGTSATPER